MARVCSICTRAERDEIDRALIESTPNRRIATQYGLTESAVRRHAAAHLPKALARAHEAAEVKRSDDLWEDAARLQDKAAALVAKAEKTGSVSATTQALQCAQRGLALMATVRAQMQEGIGPQRYAIRWLDTLSSAPTAADTSTTRRTPR